MNPPHAIDRRRDTILFLNGVSVSFDGFKALDQLAFYVLTGELRAIIGPNGAGKTTMMDVVTGKTRPDAGIVEFSGGIDLTRLDETRIANLGIGRKFQKPTVFESLTVTDNLELAARGSRRIGATLFRRLGSDQARRIGETLETIALGTQRGEIAGALSHGEKQWLEIGMVLMQDPRLLLVDEPAAGMTDAETEATAALLRRIAGERSVVVVEHDMAFVRALDCRVTVLHEGAMLAEGSLEMVRRDERVIEVYLGR